MKLRKSKQNAYWVFWISLLGALIIDLVAPGVGETLVYNIVATVMVTISIFAWTYYDAQIREASFGRGMRIGVIMLPIVFVPAYIIQTRGWRLGIIKLIRFTCLLVIVLLVLTFIAEFLGLVQSSQIQ